VLLLACLYT